MRRCSRCKEEKPEEGFGSQTSGYCIPCQMAYSRERYIPVGKQSAERRERDNAWRRKHDMKVCTVCGRKGSADVIFRKLSNRRCSDCMTKGLWRCKVHGTSRTQRCTKCRYQRKKETAKRKRAEAKQTLRKQIFLVSGDGTCPTCGKLIRVQGQLDRTHHCG